MTGSISGSGRNGTPALAALAVLLVLGLGVRLSWVLSRPTNEADLAALPDQLEYLELGRSVLRGEGLKFWDARFNDEVRAYRTPGYPLLIAVCGGSVRAVRVIQAIIDTSTILAAYLLARRWLNRGLSLFAAVLVGVNPYLIFFSGLVLSETLFASMLTWGMALTMISTAVPDSPHRPPAWRWWIGALLLAISVLVRPSAIPLPLLLGVAGAIANRGGRGPYLSRWSPPVATTMLLLTLAVLLPWGYRNYRVLGRWIFTTTNRGITLYDGFNPDASGASNQAFVQSLPQLRTMNEVQRSEYLADRAAQYVRQHPRRAVELALLKIARTWSPVPLSEDYGSRRNVVAGLSYMVPFYLLILLGLWSGRLSGSAKVYLLLPAIYFTVAHAASVGSLRYRIPCDVPMAIVAAAGLSSLWSVVSKRVAPNRHGNF